MLRERIVFTLFGLAAVACSPTRGSAQDSIPYPRSDDLKTAVKASAVLLSGDTVRVTHVVRNDAASALRLQTFVITTPVSPISMAPGARLGWIKSAGDVSDSAGLSWYAGLDALVAQGDSAPTISHVAVGVLGITRYYARGYVPAPSFGDTLPDMYKSRPRIWDDSYKGWTIAVVPFPANMTPLALTQRLEALTDQACELGWIAEPGICNSLEAKQRAARRAIQNGNLPTACNNINALVNEVNALADSKIKPEARALLRLNAQHFQRTHCGA